MKKTITLNTLLVLLCCMLSSFREGPTMVSRTVWELTQIPNIATETGRIKTSLQVADFEPVGLRATANTPLVLNVEQVSGSGLPKLIVGTYDRQTVTTYDLVAGVNTITNANGGDLYLQYSSAAPSDNNKIRVTFQSGYQLMPLYRLGATTHQEWLDMLAADTASPNVTLIANRVFIVVSQVKAEQYQNENQDTLLTLMDRVMKAEGDISGLDNSSPLHAPFSRNKLMMLEKASGNPDATSLGRVRIPTGSIHWILSPSYILEDGGWGVFHELGHHHQHSAWTWSTCIEVCVNIYSLAAKRAIHPGQQGMSTSDWNSIMNYLAQPQASKNFNAGSVSLFMRLGMFHQLWLAYGDAFYHTLHKRVRAEAPSSGTDEVEMRTFMLYACQISGHNLGQFFRNWGLNVNQSVYDEINALGYPAPATDPSSLREDLTATIIAPANNTVFPAGSNIAISATAFGPEGIRKVEFFQDGVKLGEDSTAPYSYDWNNVSPGSYALTAKAITLSGAEATSVIANVRMDAISITSPVENASFASGTPVVISANTTGSSVTKVEFYADSIKIGESSAAPYSFSWQNAAQGSYALTAKAIYQNGDTATSSKVSIVAGGLFPIADAYVRDGGTATANYGTATSLVVKKDGNSGFSRITYLKFDLHDFTSPGTAKLRLQLAGAGTAAAGTQWQVWKATDDSWTETGINWNNKPANVTLLASLPGKRTGTAEWDISNQVTEEINGDKVLSLVIVSSVSGQTNDATFHSKEAADVKLKPVLLLNNYPKITLTQPSNQDTLIEHSSVFIQANASDDQQVDSVVFYVNGEEKGTVTASPYQWNWEDVAAGTYGIRAKVTDSTQLSTWSDSITVVVMADTVPPVIMAPPAITASTASSPAVVNIGAPVVTDNGGVASITNNAPASFPVGNTIVTWTATDRSGYSASATQTVTVEYLKSAFGAVTIFAGTTNNSSHGRQVDLQAQLYLNGSLIGSGTLSDQTISGKELHSSRKIVIPVNTDSVVYTPGDVLELKLLGRRHGPNGSFGIRVWYNTGSDGSRMDKFTPVSPDGDFFYLREQYMLQSSAGNIVSSKTIPATGNYQEIGTWSTAPAALLNTLSMGKVADPETEIKAFPNPSSNEFILTMPGGGDQLVQIRIMDVGGRFVKQISTPAGQLIKFGAELKPGVYFVEVQRDNKREVLKLVKQ